MSGYSHYFWLALFIDIHRVIKLPNLLRAVVTIHHRHVAVHKNQRVFEWVIVVNRGLNLLICLLAIVGEFADLFSALDSEYHQETVDDITIEFFIITHQNLSNILRLYTEILLHEIARNPRRRI